VVAEGDDHSRYDHPHRRPVASGQKRRPDVARAGKQKRKIRGDQADHEQTVEPVDSLGAKVNQDAEKHREHNAPHPFRKQEVEVLGNSGKKRSAPRHIGDHDGIKEVAEQ
jgi:hypothetical protein